MREYQLTIDEMRALKAQAIHHIVWYLENMEWYVCDENAAEVIDPDTESRERVIQSSEFIKMMFSKTAEELKVNI